MSIMRNLNETEIEHRKDFLTAAIRQHNDVSMVEPFPEKLAACDFQWLSDQLEDLVMDILDTSDLPVIYRVAGYVGKTIAKTTVYILS